MDSEEEIRLKLIQTCALLRDSLLLTFSGGNLSARVGDYMLITPRFGAEKFHWGLTPRQLCRISLTKNITRPPQRASRESLLHFYVYQSFKRIRCLLHSHEPHLLAYAVVGRELELSGEVAKLLGRRVPLSQEAPSGSMELARRTVDVLRSAYRPDTKALSLLMGCHGVLVGADSIELAVSLLCALRELAQASLLAKMLQCCTE